MPIKSLSVKKILPLALAVIITATTALPSYATSMSDWFDADWNHNKNYSSVDRRNGGASDIQGNDSVIRQDRKPYYGQNKGSGSSDEKKEKDYIPLKSKIAVGQTLSEEDAAMRLYYINMLNGTGININGGIDFDLQRGLTRIESAVLAVRMMGEEKFALNVDYSHPFRDVPAWASPYVGYIYSLGLLSDLCEVSVYTGMFEPNAAESTERFMSYMLYALGYREGTDYTYDTVADQARDIGICLVDEDEPLVRGKAVLAIYNTLRATVKSSTRVLSDILIENGSLSYKDALFILWSDNVNETEKFLSVVGYTTEWIIPDGYYTISSAESGKALNGAFSGMNGDYEGVGITMWGTTGDITQTFRIERTERGTYYIYSAASRSGYGRVIGAAEGSSEVALYSSTSRNAMEFFIRGSADGTWTIVSASRANKCLSCTNPYSDGSPMTLADTTDSSAQSWRFERQGIMNGYGRELAIFVAESLVVTQGAFDEFSHMEQNAIDIQPLERAVRAPFNGQIVRIDENELCCNAVWLQSNEKVLYADGTYDYMTVCFMHDNDISDIFVGRGVAQGEYFYDSGDYGIASGIHVHLAVYKGAYNGSMHVGFGDVNAEDAFFIPDDTYVYSSYGLNWHSISEAN